MEDFCRPFSWQPAASPWQPGPGCHATEDASGEKDEEFLREQVGNVVGGKFFRRRFSGIPAGAQQLKKKQIHLR